MDDVATSKREADEAQRAAAAAAEAAWQEECRRMERDDFVVVCGRSPTIDGMTISKMPIMEATLTNQHAGLEEGVVVKRHGDLLIVLRRGRLFTFAIGGGRLDSRAVINASGLPDDDPTDWQTWYDELFVSEETVVVLGYGRYLEAIRIGLFDLDDAGGLRHRDTYHLRSHDYVAASNHSARLIGDRLLLSTSTWLTDHLGGGATAWHPAIRHRNSTGAVSPLRVLPGTRIMEPVTELDHHSQAHSVISCRLAPSFRCDATVVLAGSLAAYYVSPTAAYAWTSQWIGDRTGRSILYRIPLDGGPVTAIGVRGTPSSQFSFLEDEQQILNVTIDNDQGVWLLRLPLSSLSDGSEDAPADHYVPLEEGANIGATSRFFGPYVIAIVRDISKSDATGNVVAMHREDGRRFPLTVPHDIHRIDTIDGDAVMVGPDVDHGLRMTTVVFSPEPAVGPTLDLPRVPDVEYYARIPLYRKDVDGSSLLGLPIFAGTIGNWHELPPRMVFVTRQGQSLALSGTIDSEVAPDQSWDDVQTFFVDDRVFALMGSELVEGWQANGGVKVVRRVVLGGQQ